MIGDQPPDFAHRTLADAVRASACDPRLVRLFEQPRSEVIAPPVRAGVQWTLNSVADPSTLCRAAKDGAFGFALLTESALREPVSDIVVAAISARAPRRLSDALIDRIGTAVHEATVNACVHGNLGVGGSGGMTADAFYASIADSAADPERARKTVTVAAALDDDMLTIDIVDEGAGYAPGAIAEEETGEKFSGRGIGLIKAFADDVQLLDGGRRLRMRFDLGGDDDGR